jgi:hypothetical protein
VIDAFGLKPLPSTGAADLHGVLSGREWRSSLAPVKQPLP